MIELRFVQNTVSPLGRRLKGPLRRKHFRSCHLCGATVCLDKLEVHTRYHGDRGEVTGYYRQNQWICENKGDRMVRIADDVVQIMPT